ncbi:MAG: UDP-N-acetylmuramate dehydrogenase [Clostridia bacterium]|nr:UDP-N-acetylmuramate dehydrogenase [Clostridia bacterium]
MFLDRLNSLCPGALVRQGERLDQYTTLRVGGPADFFAEPENEEQLVALLAAARDTDTPALLLGNGSNLLVRDEGFPGLAIRLGKAFSVITVEGENHVIRAQAGALLSVLARAARDAALTGLEFAQGIPGSVGGGVYMNAGAYGGELGGVIASVRVLTENGSILTVPGKDMAFSYRHTRAMDKRWIILGAAFSLRSGDPAAIEAAMRDFAARRKEKQPLEYPSAGSFFKRPAGHFAGKLIEDAGLKGLTVGGAQVSEKHAGFLINRGGATAADFLRLKDLVQEKVEAAFHVRLEPEVEIVGREG